MGEIHLKLSHITKKYGKIFAVKDMNLEVEKGSFTTILGPSGCGKTTTLRIIAGFINPDDRGEIYLGGKILNEVPSHKRNIGMVFQSYALFPHMNVFNNIAYGLRLRKLSIDKIKEKVKRVLKLVGMEGMEWRMISQLSGGQQQRVALGRTIVLEPKVLLMDEPLSNLDAKLRINVRNEIKRIQRNLNITTIYVTHDQDEALSMSDKIVVMSSGEIQQIGNSWEIYNKPRNKFVADFIGMKNFIDANVKSLQQNEIMLDAKGLCLIMKNDESYNLSEGENILVSLRPEDIKITKVEPSIGIDNVLKGNIYQSSYLGRVIRYWVNIQNGQVFIVEDYAPQNFLKGEVYLTFDKSKIQFIQH